MEIHFCYYFLQYMNDAGRSGAGNYKGKVFKYFQEMHFSTYKTLKNSTTTNARKKTPKSQAIPVVHIVITLL